MPFNTTESIRAFVPAKDFDVSRAFYEALGFEKRVDGDVAIFAIGASEFILQRFYNKEFADNCMLQISVDDLDGWWAHIESLNLPAKFHVKPPRAPAVQPWGLRVAYLFDPSGVLWHIAERKSPAR